jgi:hypothetical protein
LTSRARHSRITPCRSPPLFPSRYKIDHRRVGNSSELFDTRPKVSNNNLANPAFGLRIRRDEVIDWTIAVIGSACAITRRAACDAD